MKESDIRPKDLFNEFLDLAKKDCLEFFDRGDFITVNCPACGAKDPDFMFKKVSFDYRLCQRCETLYASPRPNSDTLTHYYKEAPSNLFWVDFYGKTIESRREKIFVPRAKEVDESAKRYLGEYNYVYDVGGGHGMMSYELRKLTPDARYTIIDPSPGLTDMAREKGFFIIEKFMEDVRPEDIERTAPGNSLAMSFEILEHLFDPLVFMQAVRRILNPGDLFVFTALNNQGFDLSVLWEGSDNIFPPQHLNIFCVDSIEKLVERGGFVLLEIMTPGRLDIDIVKNKVEKVKDRFISRLINTLDDKAKEEFQKFLSENMLSSFMMCVARATE